MTRILIIAAHPDDEVLGCGGAIAKHVSNGDVVHVLFMTNGVSSREEEAEGGAKKRQLMANKSAKILGIDSLNFFDFPDNAMDSIPLISIVKKIEEIVFKIQPSVIYTHHIGDLNIDHQITHKAAMTACRPQPGFCVKEIYAFEILSSTEWQTPGVESFCPNVFIDITDYINIKKQVLNAYSEEMRQPPHSRSIDNIIRCNSLRGNSIGVDYAEAFCLLRAIK